MTRYSLTPSNQELTQNPAICSEKDPAASAQIGSKKYPNSEAEERSIKPSIPHKNSLGESADGKEKEQKYDAAAPARKNAKMISRSENASTFLDAHFSAVFISPAGR
jgi:hypothetical protein